MRMCMRMHHAGNKSYEIEGWRAKKRRLLRRSASRQSTVGHGTHCLTSSDPASSSCSAGLCLARSGAGESGACLGITGIGIGPGPGKCMPGCIPGGKYPGGGCRRSVGMQSRTSTKHYHRVSGWWPLPESTSIRPLPAQGNLHSLGMQQVH